MNSNPTLFVSFLIAFYIILSIAGFIYLGVQIYIKNTSLEYHRKKATQIKQLMKKLDSAVQFRTTEITQRYREIDACLNEIIK